MKIFLLISQKALLFLAITSPIIIAWILLITVPFMLSHVHWEILNIHMPTPSMPITFSPVAYIMSLESIQHIIISSGYPTVLKNILPLLIDLFLLLTVLKIFHWLFILGWQTLYGTLMICANMISFFLYIPRMLWKLILGQHVISAFFIWIKRYGSFLLRYSRQWSMRYILRTHLDSISKIFLPSTIPTHGKKYHEFLTPYENRSLLMRYNVIIDRIFWDKNNDSPYVSDLSRSKNEVKFTILRGESKKSLNELGETVKHARELLLELWSTNQYCLSHTETTEGIMIRIIREIQWIIQTITPSHLETLLVSHTAKNSIEKSVLGGFIPVNGQKNPQFVPYFLDILNIWAIAIIAVSQAWKDSLLRLILASTILQSHSRKVPLETSHISGKYKNNNEIIITFIDTKASDGAWLIWVPWVHRILNVWSQVANTLESLVQEMERRLESFGIFWGIAKWNKAHSDNLLPYHLICLNEINSILACSEKEDKTRIIRSLKALFSRSLASGMIMLILGQSLRREDSEIGSLLTNIATRFVGKMGNDEESRIALKWNYEQYHKSLIRYNFLHIQDSEAIEVFRPYLIEQDDLSDWIGDNFDKTIPLESQESRSNKYLQVEDGTKWKVRQASYLDNVDTAWLLIALYEGKILPRELSMQFWVTEKKFTEFKSLLVELGIIEVKAGLVAKLKDWISLEEILKKTKHLTTK